MTTSNSKRHPQNRQRSDYRSNHSSAIALLICPACMALCGSKFSMFLRYRTGSSLSCRAPKNLHLLSLPDPHNQLVYLSEAILLFANRRKSYRTFLQLQVLNQILKTTFPRFLGADRCQQLVPGSRDAHMDALTSQTCHMVPDAQIRQ